MYADSLMFQFSSHAMLFGLIITLLGIVAAYEELHKNDDGFNYIKPLLSLLFKSQSMFVFGVFIVAVSISLMIGSFDSVNYFYIETSFISFLLFCYFLIFTYYLYTKQKSISDEHPDYYYNYILHSLVRGSVWTQAKAIIIASAICFFYFCDFNIYLK